ncbi:sensor histidine kinase [Herbidospora daliensis]|uniref:sensor histidine kinase n=1 Tax=Herbidospora daliensis TaxID=295585 RepID=UPI00078178B3|nr:ATP-binding protein [Herbidospora daliensis]
MAGRKRSIRFKIFAVLLAPVTALAVVWALTAAITLTSGREYLRVGRVYEHIVLPSRAVLTELQHERLMSVTYLGGNSTFHADLDAQQKRTDEIAAGLAGHAVAGRESAPPALWDRVQELLRQLDRLDALRSQVENREIGRLDALTQYSEIAEVGWQVYDRMMIAPDLDLIDQTKAVVMVGRAREIVSQQSALLAGTLGVGRMSDREQAVFVDMAAKRSVLYSLGFSGLEGSMRDPYVKLNGSPAYLDFVKLEGAVRDKVRADGPLPPEAGRWQATAEALSITLDKLGGQASVEIGNRMQPAVMNVLIRLGVLAGVGLIALVVTLLVSVRFGRRISAELGALQNAAVDLSDRRLPDIVRRLSRGDDVDVRAETPPVEVPGNTAEVATVTNAFTSVQSTAVQAAVGQAQLRQGVNKVFLNLARRNQSLLHRQLGILDGLERQTDDPNLLEQLFGLDHLTTRMRRHAEGLIILSGAVPGRGWREPVALFDVVRASVEEVEDYLRVDVNVPLHAKLVGPAVTDAIHLIAELVENATIFSPPHTRVTVHGDLAARGFVLEIEDRGLGLNSEEMAAINERLADPPEFDLADSDRLGLFVVGRLAKRHDITVNLRPSPYGGTTAIVLIPVELVVMPEPEEIAAAERLVPAQPSEAPILAPVSGRHGAKATAETNLPRRVKQANMAPQLREEQGKPDLYSSFQAGWRRAEEDKT